MAVNQVNDNIKADNAPIVKVVVLTLVVNETLEYNEHWAQIKKTLVEQLDAVSKQHKGVLLGMNVVSNGERTKNFKYDRMNETSWREWSGAVTRAQNDDDHKFIDILQMNRQDVIGKLRV